MLLFFKAHVKGYTRSDGVFVKDHDTKVIKKIAPAKALWAGATSKVPLDDSAFVNVGKPAELPPVPPPKSIFPAGKVSPTWPFKEDSAPPAKAKWINSLHGKPTSPAPQPSLFGGAGLHSRHHYPDAIDHPQLNDEGKRVQINEPSTPSAPATWSDPAATAVFVPGGDVPAVLNGVAVTPWTDHPKTKEGWEYVDGQMHDLDEPDLDSKGKAPAAGVIIEEPDGRIWLVSPSNAFAGYATTFPKGHADDGLSLQATAIKECFEESGLRVEITGLHGDVERGKTMTRYYRARRVGGSPSEMGWETQAVQLVPKERVHAAVNRNFDREVATLAGIAAPGGLIESADDWEKIGKQAGSNPGGVFRDEDGRAWYVKLPRSANIAKNEVLAAKLYRAAGVKVPDLKPVTVGGKPAIASGMIDGLQKLPDDAASVRGVMDGFAVDAWLANWDVVGLLNDNLLADPEGNAVRVDVGGALIYRAQGDLKGAAFGNKVAELDTLTNGKNKQAAAVFGAITHADLVAGFEKVASVSEDTIEHLCDKYGPGDAAQRVKLANTLKARKSYLVGLLKSV